MILRHFLLDANESNGFIVGCEETRDALLVDAGAYDPAIPAFLEEHSLRLSVIFITHDHWDHTGGLEQLLREHGAEVYAGRNSAGGCPASQVHEGSTVRVGNLSAAVLAVPGHTADSVCLAFPGCVFTGDALFAGSVGGTASSGAHRELIDGIRAKIFSMPPETRLHPGHGPSSTVAIESRYNPFFV